MAKKINPNSDRDTIEKADITQEKIFPKFLTKVRFEPFRHIKKLNIKFESPISVVSGTNRIGKSTLLMAVACSHFDFQKGILKMETSKGKLGAR